MAADSDGKPTNQEPGFGMRLCIEGIRRKFSSVKTITSHELATRIKQSQLQNTSSTPVFQSDNGEKIIILDTRPEEEHRVGHIPGAVRVNYEAEVDSIVSSLPELSNEKLTVVCYCSVGYRSSVVAQKLDKYIQRQESSLGPEVKVYNLEGSIFKWANEGRQMVNARNEPTTFTHPYNSVYGKLLNKEYRKSSI